MEADVDCHTNHEAAFLLKTVKRMLYLGNVLLRYVLIYNLKVSFNVHCAVKTVFFTLLLAIFFELLITRTFLRFPLKVRVIGSRL